jgi:hypothetical protein
MNGPVVRPTYKRDQVGIDAALVRLRAVLAQPADPTEDDDLPLAPSADETVAWIVPGLVAPDDTGAD